MPFIYTDTPAAPGNIATNATANTATETFFAKPGTRTIQLVGLNVQGKSSAATTITGLIFRIYKWATSSTAGTAITPSAPDPGMQAAKHTAASRPTVGATRTNGPIFGCGKAGPGGYIPPAGDAVFVVEGSGAGSVNMEDAAGEASLNFEFSFHIQE